MTTGDPDIDRALRKLAESTTEAEVFDWFMTAMDRGASYRECRDAVRRWEQKRGQA